MYPSYRPFPQYWTSNRQFVIGLSMALISLGSVWRIPALAAAHGGSAFVWVYIAALITMGWPMLAAQLLMVRGTQRDVPGVIAHWTHGLKSAVAWRVLAYAMLVGALMLLAAYAVVASWSLAYTLRALGDALVTDTPDGAARQFASLARDGERGLGWLLLFMAAVSLSAARGSIRGIGPILRTLAFCAVAVLLALLSIGLLRRGPWIAIHLIIGPPHFSVLGAVGVCEAFYQAFFSLSLGSGVVLALGSHLETRAPVLRLSAWVTATIALTSLMLIALVSTLFDDQALATLVGVQSLFLRLPLLIGDPGLAAGVFVLVALIALSTGIGLFEPLVQSMQHHTGWSRGRASGYTGVIVTGLALVAQNALGILGFFRPLGYDLFDWMTLISARGIFPLAGLCLCILVAHVVARRKLQVAWQGEDDSSRRIAFTLWHAALRYPARIGLILVMAYALDALDIIRMIWRPT